MTIELSNCLCCNAPYLNGAYMCDCRQDKEADCHQIEGKWYCKVHCPCSHVLAVHPLDLPLAAVWDEAINKK